MRRKIMFSILLCLLITMFAVSTESAAVPGVPVSDQLIGDVVVQGAGPTEATWAATNAYGTHDGTVYTEFELLDSSSVRIPLDTTHVTSVTVTKPDGTTKTLEINTDTTLWFNVANPSGNYVYDIVMTDGATYTATINWAKMNILNLGWTLPTAPVTVNSPFNVVTTAQINEALTGSGPIDPDRIMYIIEVTKGGVTATGADISIVANGQDGAGNNTITNIPVPYNSEGYFYFGDPTTGFTFSADGTVTTTFTTTIKTAGTYAIKAYAVQLP